MRSSRLTRIARITLENVDTTEMHVIGVESRTV